MTPDPAPAGPPSGTPPAPAPASPPSGTPPAPAPANAPGAPKQEPASVKVSGMSREAANVAAAGLMAAAAAFGQWASLTARYFEQIRPALGGASGDAARKNDPASVLLDGYVAYLRDVAELPRYSVLRFYNELARLRGETPPS
jgi:hypothetical protein